MQAADERRTYVRKSLKSTVSVFDRETNDYIGLVADYSENGLLVTCSINPIEPGKVFRFMLLVQSTHGADSNRRASIDGESVWCEQTSPSFFGTGFRVNSLSDDALKLLQACSD